MTQSLLPADTHLAPGVDVLAGDLFIDSCAVRVRAFPGTVRVGYGALVYAHSGVSLDLASAGDGTTIYLAPGATIEEPPTPGALEACEVTVVPWVPAAEVDIDVDLLVDERRPAVTAWS